jgi:hypothetical protein
MMNNDWNDLHLESKLLTLLSEIPVFQSAHHLGRPFLTSYQVAILFKHRYPNDFARMGIPIDASDVPDEISLARYFAQHLSDAIKHGLPHVEGAVLSYQHLEDITLDNDGESVRPSRFPVSMFRYVDQKVE